MPASRASSNGFARRVSDLALTPLPLSKLKGIEVYYPDDLYEFAELMVKLIGARDCYEKPNTRSRPSFEGSNSHTLPENYRK